MYELVIAKYASCQTERVINQSAITTHQENSLELFQTEESSSARTCSAILISVQMSGIVDKNENKRICL